MIVPVGTWEGLRKCQPKSLGQTNFATAKMPAHLQAKTLAFFVCP